MEYPARFEPAPEGGFVVTFPDFTWGVTQGDTEAEAGEMAADALAAIVEEHIRSAEPLPRPSKPRGRKYRRVRLPALAAAKAELYQTFFESGVRKSELARRVGISKTNVDRLFDLRHRSRLDQLEKAFRVLGKELRVEVRNAA
jgi:antitoxin HicB